MSVELLPDDNYRGFIEEVQAPGQEPIHIARVRFGDEVTRRAYVKIYPPSSRGLFNEVAGHLLAGYLGMKVPDKAAVLFVPRDVVAWPPSWIATGVESLPAWCTVDMAAPSIKFFFRLGDEKESMVYAPIRDEMEKSKQTPVIMAFDDWVANVDRNVGNLLRFGRGDYLLIDHGRILGGGYWTPAMLREADRKFPNRLRELIGFKTKTLPFQTQLVNCCEQHAQALEQAWDEIAQWWSDMDLSGDDQKAAQDFLHARARFEDLPKRYGLLL